jgi:hypothetical protein
MEYYTAMISRLASRLLPPIYTSYIATVAVSDIAIFLPGFIITHIRLALLIFACPSALILKAERFRHWFSVILQYLLPGILPGYLGFILPFIFAATQTHLLHYIILNIMLLPGCLPSPSSHYRFVSSPLIAIGRH